METTEPTEHTIALQRLRTIVLARWFGAVFAVFQVLAYRTLPYPDGVREFALGLIVVFAASNVAAEVVRRRELTATQLRRLALAVLVTDVVMASAITWVYAFDGVSAIFTILFLLPIEGAVLFGLPGAMWTWGAVALLYAGREWFGTRYGNPFEFESVTFRVGLIGIVGGIVGVLVRDLVRQRRETLRALHEAEQATESRTRLISMLAHDVRAPIAGARTAVDTLTTLGDRASPDQRARLLAAGKRQADRALYLAADLLDLARVEAGILSVDLQRVALAPLLHRVQEVIGERAAVSATVGELAVVADPARLEQVLYNLLDNAAKYGEPPIEVVARSVSGGVLLTVRDHGDGVPEDVDLFSPFAAAGDGAVGLGVWIVGHLVPAMGGTVEYRDADPGARFDIRLPVPPEDRPGSAAAGRAADPAQRGAT